MVMVFLCRHLGTTRADNDLQGQMACWEGMWVGGESGDECREGVVGGTEHKTKNGGLDSTGKEPLHSGVSMGLRHEAMSALLRERTSDNSLKI